MNSWTMWYCRHLDRSKSWEDCLLLIATVKYVESFWSMYNHIQQPSCLSRGANYYFFKEGIKPMWEDPKNVNGGRWLITIDKSIDHYWKELLVAMVGEQFIGLEECICGATLSIRQSGNRIALWTKGTDQENETIGCILKQKIGISDDVLSYELHK